MTIFRHLATGEQFDDGVPGDLGHDAPLDIAIWHWNSTNFEVVGPSPDAAPDAPAPGGGGA